MFTSSKFAAVCLAVSALSGDVHAETEAAQTFGPLLARPYDAPRGGVRGVVGINVGLFGRGVGDQYAGNQYASNTQGGAAGGGVKNDKVYNGVNEAAGPGPSIANGPVKSATVGAGGNAGTGGNVKPCADGGAGKLGGTVVPESGKPATGGASGNAAPSGTGGDKINNAYGGGAGGAAEKGGDSTKGAGQLVSDGKDRTTTAAGGDKTAGGAGAGAAVPEAGKPATGGASGNAAPGGAGGDKINNAYGGVVGGAAGGAGKPPTAPKGNTQASKPPNGGGKMGLRDTPIDVYAARPGVGAARQRAYRNLRS